MSTDLKSLREYVANVLDYDPVNTTYKAQVDQLLNEADRRICTEKLYTFAQSTQDVTVYADKAVNVEIQAGGLINGAAGTFEPYMAGHIIEIDGTEYQIAWVKSDVKAYLTTEPAAAAIQPATVIQRYIFLPQDLVQIMGLARRSQAITPSNPGMLQPITQYEDEWSNLPLGETGLPEVFVPASPTGVPAPRIGVTTGTAAGLALGVRTVEVGVVHQFATYKSAVSDVQTVSLTATQELTVTPASAVANTSGLYRQVYLRAPLHGLDDWRPALTNIAGTAISMAPDSTATVTVRSSLANIQSESYYVYGRMVAPTGVCDRIRLYPRQSETMTLQLRYLSDHQPMVEDNDTSSIPAAHRMVIAYRALYEVLFKHDNPSLSELYYKRYQQELLQLERRYLSQPSRRLIKGFLTPSRMPDGPYRRRKLVRL